MLRVVILTTFAASTWQQGMLMDLHPAAGPHVFPENMVGSMKMDNIVQDLENEFSSLVDPEGRPIDEPLKARAMVIEEELRREAVEIQRILHGSDSSKKVPFETWLFTLIGCSLVVSCGVIPAFLLPADTHALLSSEEGKKKLNLLLAFAVGSLLGDVFLHLLPEAYATSDDFLKTGLVILAGAVSFSLLEKIGASSEGSQHQLCAVMNLAANIVDNFTHGLAVGGSFLVSAKFGILTTVTILIHELPHEVSDYAILLRADYAKSDAIKAQLVTSSAGILGSCGALWLHTSNFPVVDTLLPFTAGGFLNIALTQLLPELNEEKSPTENIKQLGMVLVGVMSMSALNMIAF